MAVIEPVSEDEMGPWAVYIAKDGRLVDDMEPRLPSDRAVEVVPASQLRGAVKRADDLSATIQNILDADFHYPEEYRQSLQEALDADSGGQYGASPAHPRKEQP